MKPYYSLKCYANGFPSLKGEFSTLVKAQARANGLLADGYHTVEVLRYDKNTVRIIETVQVQAI